MRDLSFDSVTDNVFSLYECASNVPAVITIYRGEHSFHLLETVGGLGNNAEIKSTVAL